MNLLPRLGVCLVIMLACGCALAPKFKEPQLDVLDVQNTATQTAPRQGTSDSAHNPPAATSTSAAQPFSEKTTPAPPPALKKDAAAAAEKKATPLVRSSVPAGTPLKGLNFLKDKQDPVALADEEYPEWLWTVLTRQEKGAEAAGQGDLFCTFATTLPTLNR